MNETKKLYRVRQGKMLAGVCGGAAEYFNIDVNLIRLGLVIFSLLGGAGVLAYIIAAVIIPEKDIFADVKSENTQNTTNVASVDTENANQ